MSKCYFVTGIGTGVGKTLVSTLLCQHLKADYFKPVQTGYPPDRDSEWVKQMVDYPIILHPERYLLKTPASPHLAADDEHIQIDIQNIILPNTSNHLIIEGAGGLLVPLNQRHYIADLIRHLNAECVLVINNYLGCINHSLLSLYYLQKENIPFKGIVLNGSFDQRVKSAITKNLDHSKIISEISCCSEKIEYKNFQHIYEEFIKNLNVEL